VDVINAMILITAHSTETVIDNIDLSRPQTLKYNSEYLYVCEIQY